MDKKKLLGRYFLVHYMKNYVLSITCDKLNTLEAAKKERKKYHKHLQDHIFIAKVLKER